MFTNLCNFIICSFELKSLSKNFRKSIVQICQITWFAIAKSSNVYFLYHFRIQTL